ncbi:MAG: heparan N-sulfatase, partial [Verrucomicrobia bacterium]
AGSRGLVVGAEVEAKPFQARPNILFCLADDWAWPHAGAYGDKIVKTPAFVRVAREGILFTHAFSAAPSCTPSRAAILTGQAPHRLEEGGNLHGFLPNKFPVYPELLERAGYVVGFSGKGWGPGNFQAGGRTRNPAGPNSGSFKAFLKNVPADKPFCFWFGSHDPHRPYEKGSGVAAGLNPRDVIVPPCLPDTPEIRSDILDYYLEVQRFDHDVGELLGAIEAAGQSQNTLVVISGDNGWPFPRGKANLYDAGTRQPLAIRWPAKVASGKTIDAFVNLADLAPTFLHAAGLKPLPGMTGQSLLPLPTGKTQPGRDMVFVERERHANVRKGDLSYPARAVRTKEFLYIRNLRPDRWPAGDPEMWKAVGPFGDCDGSPSKEFLLGHRDESEFAKLFQLAFAKRPAEELYDLSKDPHQIVNVADRSEYVAAKKKLRARLDRWMTDTKDPLATSDDDPWDRYPYFGSPP